MIITLPLAVAKRRQNYEPKAKFIDESKTLTSEKVKAK